MIKNQQTLNSGNGSPLIKRGGKVVGILGRSGIAFRTGTGQGKRFQTGKKGEPLFGSWKSIRYLSEQGKIRRIK